MSQVSKQTYSCRSAFFLICQGIPFLNVVTITQASSFKTWTSDHVPQVGDQPPNLNSACLLQFSTTDMEVAKCVGEVDRQNSPIQSHTIMFVWPVV